jgi:hypothetical protein
LRRHLTVTLVTRIWWEDPIKEWIEVDFYH